MKTTIEIIKFSSKDCLKHWKALLLFSGLIRIALYLSSTLIGLQDSSGLSDLVNEFYVYRPGNMLSFCPILITVIVFAIRAFAIDLIVGLTVYILLLSPQKTKAAELAKSWTSSAPRFLLSKAILIGLYLLWLGLTYLLLYCASAYRQSYASAGSNICTLLSQFLAFSVILAMPFLFFCFNLTRVAIVQNECSFREGFRRTTELLTNHSLKKIWSYLKIELILVIPYIIAGIYVWNINYPFVNIMMVSDLFPIVLLLNICMEPLRYAAYIRLYRKLTGTERLYA